MRTFAWSYGNRGFFGPMPAKPGRMRSFVECKTLAHALAQYRRLKVCDRHMDATPKRGARYVVLPKGLK